MEIVILSIIILGYCLILGVDFNYIILVVLMLIGIFFGLLSLGFIYCFIRLFFSKLKTAKFLRFEKLRNDKYQAACYLVEGEEYLCIFPREGVMKNKLYQQDKIYHVMLNKRMRKVYDRFAIATCVIGLIFSIGLSIGIFAFVVQVYL